MTGSEITLPPIRQYGKKELYLELKDRNLVAWSYNRFMQWAYDDPLCELVNKSPALKTRKVLLVKEVRLLLECFS